MTEIAVEAYLEVDNGTVFQADVELELIWQNRYMARLVGRDVEISPKTLTYVRFVFSLEKTIVSSEELGDLALIEFIEKFNLRFVGHYAETEELGQALMLYSRLPRDLERQ